MNGSLWVASLWLFLLGGGLALLAWYFRKQEQKSLGFRPVTEGRVVEIRTEPAKGESGRGEFHDLHYAVIEYFAEGKLMEVKSPTSRFPSDHYVGQKLSILYEKEQPEAYEILHPGRWSLLARVSNICSLALLISGLLTFFFAAAGR